MTATTLASRQAIDPVGVAGRTPSGSAHRDHRPRDGSGSSHRTFAPCPRARARRRHGRPGRVKVHFAARDLGERRRWVHLKLEAEPRRVEVDRGRYVVDDVTKAVDHRGGPTFTSIMRCVRFVAQRQRFMSKAAPALPAAYFYRRLGPAGKKRKRLRSTPGARVLSGFTEICGLSIGP